MLVAALAVLVFAPAAGARVPQQFVGMNWDGPIARAPRDLQERQFARMAAAGVESVRAPFSWARAQPQQDGPIDLSASDALVEMASARHMTVLPIVIVAPEWVRVEPQPLGAPADPEAFRPYVSALVERYGPSGSFWTDHPALPRMPIRTWQFWNEPHIAERWAIPPSWDWDTSYASQLRVFHSAVKNADPGAKVVLAGLSNVSWRYLDLLYRAGAKAYFDIATVHPYTAEPAGVVELVRRFRRVMRRHHDSGKPVWVTELGRPASRGRSSSKNTLQTTDRGMARFLDGSYRALARTRRVRSVRASRAYWYTWASPYRGRRDIFQYTGLFRYAGRGTPAARPAYRTFVRVARRLEGCRKNASGVCR